MLGLGGVLFGPSGLVGFLPSFVSFGSRVCGIAVVLLVRLIVVKED